MFDILSIKVWLMESGYFDRIHPLAYSLLSEGKDLSKLIKKPEAEIYPKIVDYDRDSGLRIMASKTQRRIGRIAISGGMTKNGDLCAYGTRHYVQMIEAANNSKNVDAILLEMDTPGGSVDGTEELGLAVKNSQKPVVVFGDQMVASAGYWVASQASEIVANQYNDTEFGSIGVLYVHENWAKRIEEKIGSVKIFRAPQSVDKARVNPIEELTEEQEAEITAELKTIASKFISTVKAGRKGKLNTGEENIFTGKMYSREKALEMGMIDAIGTREDAIERAAALAESKISISNSNNKQSNNMKWSKISSLFGGNVSEEKEELSADEQAKLDAAEQKLTDQEKQIGDLQAQVSAKDAEIAALKAEKEALAGEKATLETANADLQAILEKAPAGQATTVITNADESADEPERVKTSIEVEADGYRKVIDESKQFNLK